MLAFADFRTGENTGDSWQQSMAVDDNVTNTGLLVNSGFRVLQR